MILAPKYKLLIAASCLVLSGCQDNQDHRSDLQRSAGTWHKPAYGEALHITMSRVLRYQYNSYDCIQTSELTHQQANRQLEVKKVHSTERLRLIHKDQVYPIDYRQIAAIPTQCDDPISASKTVSPVIVFDYFWHTFNDYYAFFSIRNLDWQAQYDQYRPLVTESMTEQALFDVLSEMIAPLQDMHASISSPQQEYFSRKSVPLLNAVQQEMANLNYLGEEHDMYRIFEHYQSQLQSISQHYITPDSLTTIPENSHTATAIWGKTADNIGILVLNNMDSYSEAQTANESQQLLAAHKMMSRVMTDLGDTDAMLLDIRHNTGGDDAISLAIAGYFADKEVLAFNKQAINQTGRGIPVRQKLTLNPNAYTKPVYLLTSQLTVSAAEVFTMAMDQLDHVTKVGEETAGALSDALRFELPNGWQLSLSNEIYRNAQGDMFEHTGFTPDHHVPAFSQYDIEMQRFETYEFVFNKLNKDSRPTKTVADFEREISALQKQGDIATIAVNIVSQGQSIYSQGFTTNKRNLVNADTPFYLSSLNDILVGATIAHASIDGHFSLDESIDDVLPFALEYPVGHDHPVTLSKLLTHTSGIVDNPKVLNCAGHAAELVTSCVHSHKARENLLKAYLSAEGELYQTGNFSSHYGVTSEHASLYSQMGIELATFVLEQSSQEPISSLAQRYVFEPLKMQNTYWQPSSDSTTTRAQFVSTANDLSHLLIASMHQAIENDTPLPTYFWHTDNQKFYYRGNVAAPKAQFFADLYNQTGFILLTDSDPGSKKASAAYQKLEKLIFDMTMYMHHQIK
ncbi:S41 family peptidase [Pseudoalteromonas luteoviolacea]|uniref:S41 family peptidase n=1 Tax=Pseudoalteromonas luteoviolacea TaxID=43657 RepID=UPI001B3845CF|nr:S41 family peptidase [Pseudoalteromonas luteoviolacea]MBQ4839957.1 serine hydrolase [Pseudoalteromonas luteoviolacea]